MLAKNNNTIEDICEVSLKSVWGNTFPDLAAIYTTLSKIQWKSRSRQTPNGSIYDNTLELSYPGLNDKQFKELDDLIRGMYQVRVRTEKDQYYDLAWEDCPMAASISFNNGRTEITFSQKAIEPIKYIGAAADPVEELGFPYTLTFTLS
ncbi:hypothetical protein JM79_3217 [Gramella sp. Hel_I_59]|uniref:hypothetical protein n=1 Tax=Gramella sp. Hel_I_59 TaxID=1249978 RepID=UPI00114E7875|nr:hypothetical protein [Gramella sp. Hel_I_59]TQI72260.1 hypothetical protein JM79_3217 [Gramella sp. Hel_I_59]